MKIVFATNNENKLLEVKRLVPEDVEIVSLKEIGCIEDIPEPGETIEENAYLKAKYVKEKYGYDVFSDDTGLEVDALGGQPGVYSARYASEEKNNLENIKLLLKNMEGKEDRKAKFKTVICLMLGEKIMNFEGIVRGKITEKMIGEGGFGYDAVFEPDDMGETFAQMSMEKKNSISHRGRAVSGLINFLKNR